MFAIIISEKGGVERRQSFEQPEITVGRVQGNELMLPKGNVSKQHAKLLFRDGRFIVTDLKSTNGTYVNGRKIAQPTIVRETDKIYIGDFMLRLDAGASASASASAPVVEDEDRVAPPPPLPAGMMPPNAPLGSGGAAGGYGGYPEPARGPSAPAAPRASGGFGPPPPLPVPEEPIPPPEPEKRRSVPPTALSAQGAAPSPTRKPATVQLSGALGRSTGQGLGPGGAPRAGAPSATSAPAPTRPPALSRPPPPLPPQASAGAASSPPPPLPSAARDVGSGGASSRVPTAEKGRLFAIATLRDRIASSIDLSALDASPVVEDALARRIERAAEEQARGMEADGELAPGIDLATVTSDVVRELVRLGPLQALLDDRDVGEIYVPRHADVLAYRGQKVVRGEPGFSDDEAVRRAVMRLAARAGRPVLPNEAEIERRLPHGEHLFALLPPAVASPIVVIRKRRRLEATFESLTEDSVLSPAMATFLEAAVAGGANVVLAGPGAGVLGPILAAIVSAIPAGERVVVVRETDALPTAHLVALSVGAGEGASDGDRALRSLARLQPDRLVVPLATSDVAAASIEALSDGVNSVVVGVAASSLRQGLARLAGQVLLRRPGLAGDAIRECIGEGFDLGIEVARLPDGRLRVQRIAELAGADARGIVVRDLFQCAEDGSFTATGIVPRMATELQQRGVRLDAGLFKRGR